MMKYFITLLCVSLSIPVIAGGPKLSQSDIGHVTMIENQVPDASATAGAESVQSSQQSLQERHLTLNDNNLNNKSPRSQSIEDLLGAKIASVDAYNFNWNNETGTAEIYESACAMMGKSCKLKSHSSKDGDVYLSNFYGDFEIPFKIDTTTGIVTIKTGQPLCTMYRDPNSAKSKSLMVTGNARWTLYAVPFSWLMGNDDLGEFIYGQVIEDTIAFNDIFAFLVKTVDGDSVSWGLSPIFKNLTLLTPNGTHGFYYTRPSETGDIGPGTEGHGGLVPRPNKPGSSKPVSPRPFSSIIEANNPSSNNNQFIKKMPYTHLLHIKELQPVVGPVCLPDGYGGSEPGRHGKPGSSKPKSTGPFNDLVYGGEPGIDCNTVIKTGVNPNGTEITTHELVPVYMAFADDTTLMVYNLFGMGLRCHMIIDNNNGTMYLPKQQIYNDGLGKIIINKSSYGTISQDGAIMWEETSGYMGNVSWLPKFESNVLQFLGDSPFVVPLEPEFDEPVVTDTEVVFSATTVQAGILEVFLYMYDDESDDYFEVYNPFTVPRLNTPYGIYLAAIAYNPNTGVSSDITWFEYEVPALALEGMRGDVNNDGAVNISDVTAMIDGLLTNNWDGKNYHNADCNLDKEVSISDVTIMIDYLLTGTWTIIR